MSPDERSSIDNGIWLCYNHGRLVDTDERRFTIEMLKAWRTIAERRARLELEVGPSAELTVTALTDVGLVENSVSVLGVGAENVIIGDALHDSCVPAVWGEEVCHALRDVAVELARNAFHHGKANAFRMHIQPRSILLVDDGKAFDPLRLTVIKTEGGGAVAVKHLLSRYGNRLVLVSRRVMNQNETTICLVRRLEDVAAVTPCTIELNHEHLRSGRIEISLHESCLTAYVILPRYFAISDVLRILPLLSTALGSERRPLTFVATDVSDLVRQKIAEAFPGSQLLVI
jgi:hypothetical protein